MVSLGVHWTFKERSLINSCSKFIFSTETEAVIFIKSGRIFFIVNDIENP